MMCVCLLDRQQNETESEILIVIIICRMVQMSVLVGQLQSVETARDEIDILSNLIETVRSSDIQLPVLDSVSKDNTSLDYLISYVFDRRYGWSEADSAPDLAHCRRLSIMRRSATADVANLTAFIQEDLRHKTCINEQLDLFINW